MLPPEPQPTRWDLRWRMFGAEVRIRPIFWASCVLLGAIVYRDRDIGGMAMFWFWSAAVLISLLVHETCHILIARLFGTRLRIALSGLGGHIHGLDELKRWQRVLVLLAGSLGNLLIYGILLVVIDPQWDPLPIQRLGPEWAIFVVNAVKIVWLFNAFWALLNVLPLWPLDGGRVAVELGEALLGRRGRIAALSVSLAVCLWLSVTAVGWARRNLIDRFDPSYPLYLLYFGILVLYCFLFWMCAFRALWGDSVPFDETDKSDRAA